MSPTRQHSNPLSKHSSLVFSVITFMIGWGISGLTNYMNYSNKVDQLITKVNDISDDLKERQSKSAEYRLKTNSRLTALEVKVFGNAQQISQTEPRNINYYYTTLKPGR